MGSASKGYKTESALKAHITRTHKQRSWHGSTADKDTREAMHKAMQENLPAVTVDSPIPGAPKIKIENVWLFKYLGSLFRADGDQIADIKARIAMARQTAGK